MKVNSKEIQVRVSVEKAPTPETQLVSAGMQVVLGDHTENRVAPIPTINWPFIEVLNASSELTVPLRGQVESCVKEQIKAICTIRYISDDLIVQRLYYLGMVLNNTERLLGSKSRYTVWREDCIGTDSGVVETSRQARKIARMGPEILRFALLGKNRVLELFYLFTGLEEYERNPNPEFIRNELGKIMQEFPFDIRPEMSDEDIQKFREHMDSVITIFRLRKATGLNDICRFDNALRISRARGLAIEVQQAKEIATLLKKPENRTSQAELFQHWVDGISVRDSTRRSSHEPLRVIELFAAIGRWNRKNEVNQDLIAKINLNPFAKDAIKHAYDVVMPLYTAIMSANSTVSSPVAGGAV